MAQTTNYFGLASGSPRLEYNTSGGSTYTDASGEIVSVTWGAGERGVGEINTLDGEYAIIAPGKVAATEMTIRAVYTGTSSGFWTDASTSYETGSPIYLRYYPAGSAANRYRYTSGTNGAASAAGSANSGACYVMGRPVANADASTPDVFTYEVTIKAVTFTRTAL